MDTFKIFRILLCFFREIILFILFLIFYKVGPVYALLKYILETQAESNLSL